MPIWDIASVLQRDDTRAMFSRHSVCKGVANLESVYDVGFDMMNCSMSDMDIWHLWTTSAVRSELMERSKLSSSRVHLIGGI
jgi:hypothetical protein